MSSARRRRIDSAEEQDKPLDVLHIYMRDIGRTPLLSQCEEKELARRMYEGDPRAREQMVRANLRIVVNLARGYVGRGLSLLDLIEEGNFGLLRATEEFEPAKGYTFCSYAGECIKRAMREALLSADRLIRIPAEMQRLLKKWQCAIDKLTRALGHTPSNTQIALYLEVERSLATIEEALALPEVRLIGNCHDGDDDSRLGNFDDDSACSSADLRKVDSIELLMLAIRSLDDRRAELLGQYYRLAGYEKLSFPKIGKAMKITDERARQIRNDALAKLRRLLVEEYWDDTLFAWLATKALSTAQKSATPPATKTGKSKKTKTNTNIQATPPSDQELAEREVIISLRGEDSHRKEKVPTDAALRSAATRKQRRELHNSFCAKPATADQALSDEAFSTIAHAEAHLHGGHLEVDQLLDLIARLHYETPAAFKQPGVDVIQIVSQSFDQYKAMAERRFLSYKEMHQILLHLGFRRKSSSDPPPSPDRQN